MRHYRKCTEKWKQISGNNGCSATFSSRPWASAWLSWSPTQDPSPSRKALWLSLASLSFLPPTHSNLLRATNSTPWEIFSEACYLPDIHLSYHICASWIPCFRLLTRATLPQCVKLTTPLPSSHTHLLKHCVSSVRRNPQEHLTLKPSTTVPTSSVCFLPIEGPLI